MSRYRYFVSYVCLVAFVLLCPSVECKSVFGIGMRIFGDQLLLKDVQQSRPAGISEQPTLSFNYAIPEPITYIEILSEDNIYAEVDFSYQDNLVRGTVTGLKPRQYRQDGVVDEVDEEEHVNSTTKITTATTTTTTTSLVPELITDNITTHHHDAATKQSSFEILITIYGYNDTMLNVSPAYILNRDQQFEGVLQPLPDDDDDDIDIDDEEEDEDDYVDEHEYLNKRTATLELMEDDDDVDDDDINEGDDDGDDDEGKENNDDDIDFDDRNDRLTTTTTTTTGDNDIEKDNDFDHSQDKIIEIGKRQMGDYLIYETYQTSAQSTIEATNHTVTFYYIDSDYITYVKFIIFDHFTDKPHLGKNYIAPVAEYSHYSPNTLKAIITEFNTTSLFVQMFVYGYKPLDKPADYEAFLPPPHWRRTFVESTDAPLTAIQRLQQLINSEFARENKNTPIPFTDNDTDDSEDQNSFVVAPEDTEVDSILAKPSGHHTQIRSNGVTTNLNYHPDWIIETVIGITLIIFNF